MFRFNLGRSFSKILLAIAAVGISSSASQAATPKLMLLGDSLTHGNGGYVGFRYPLYYDLQAGGLAFDYVGTRTDTGQGATPIPSLYPNYFNAALFDNQSEGHWGYTTDQIINDGAGFTIAASASTYVPDVVSVMLGTNDLSNHGGGSAHAITNLGTIVNSLRAANPNVKILVSQLTPLLPGAYDNQFAAIPGFNSAVAGFVTSKNTIASPVSLVDQFTGFDPRGLLQGDGIHPNQYGEQLMADRYYRALQPILAPGQPVKSPAIHLANPDFDDTAISDNVVSTTPRSQGWTFNTTSSSDGGIFNPNSATYPAAGGSASALGASGSNVAYVYNGQNAASAGRSSISENFGATLQPATNYTLTVAVGNRLTANPFGTSYGGYEIDLLAGGTVIASQLNTITPTAGTFADASFTLFSDSVSSALLNQELSVRLSETSNAQFASTDFDNIRLTSAAVPEPASTSLLFLVATATLRRRRCSR